MERAVAHSIVNTKLTFSEEEYSKFKYGSKSLAKKFASELWKKTKNQILKKISSLDKYSVSIIIYGAPYNQLPVASTFLAKYFSQHIDLPGVTVKNGKISRLHSYHDDYGSMSIEDRSKSLSGESFSFVDDPNKYDIVIFIDDIFITGAHEVRVSKLAKEVGVLDKSMFLYYAKLDTTDIAPQLESHLNLFALQSEDEILNHFKSISKNLDVAFNTRTIKYLLRLESELLEKICYSMPRRVYTDFIKNCQKNGYSKHELYKENYKSIKSINY